MKKIINVIKNHTKCVTLPRNFAEKSIMKHIIPEGPHFHYQADLWELFKKNFND